MIITFYVAVDANSCFGLGDVLENAIEDLIDNQTDGAVQMRVIEVTLDIAPPTITEVHIDIGEQAASPVHSHVQELPPPPSGDAPADGETRSP